MLLMFDALLRNMVDGAASAAAGVRVEVRPPA